jgi:hypothetical protein
LLLFTTHLFNLSKISNGQASSIEKKSINIKQIKNSVFMSDELVQLQFY